MDEAHGLRKDTLRELLTAIDHVPPHVTWIFMTTQDGQDSLFEEQIDAGPLRSRCFPLPLSQRAGKDYARYAKQVAEKEGLDGKPIDVYEKRLSMRKGNLRALLQDIEAGVMSSDDE